MPGMIPHFVSDFEVLLACSSTGEYLLAGRLDAKRDVKSVYEITRLRWSSEGGCFYRSRKHPKITSWTVGRSAVEDFYTSFDWWEDRASQPLKISLSPLEIRCRVYASQLKKFAMLAAKCDGDDQLITIQIHSEGVRLQSMGRTAMGLEVSHVPTTPAYTGLGSCVVFASAFKQALTDTSAEPTIGIGHVGIRRDRILTLDTVQLWTVNRTPLELKSPPAAERYPIAEAVRAAMAFAYCRAKKSDNARPNLAQVGCFPTEDGVEVVATNGSVCHMTLVPDVALPRVVHLPSALRKNLPKRGDSLAFAFLPSATRLQIADDMTISIYAGLPMPPFRVLYTDARKQTRAYLDLTRSDRFRASVVALAKGVDCYGEKLVYVRCTPSEAYIWDVDDEPLCAAFVSEGRRWTALDGSNNKNPSAFERAVRVDVLRLKEALAVMPDELQLGIGTDPTAPLYIRTSTQEHLLMPCGKSQ